MDTIIPRQFNYNETNIFLAFSIQLIVNLTIAKVTPTFLKRFLKCIWCSPRTFTKCTHALHLNVNIFSQPLTLTK